MYDITIEAGKKKAFAVAVDWPGWCRSGKDEALAVQALLDVGGRYGQVLKAGGVEFQIPQSVDSLKVVERLEGSATTDFGAPDQPLASDWDPGGADELVRYVTILKACWLAFDEAAARAEGKELRKGPRGGGRDLAGIVDHVLDAEMGYLRALGWQFKAPEGEAARKRKDTIRGEVLRGLEAGTGGELPREGPRGGKRWPVRFFVRRLAWHAVDHAWEIEDRIVS